MKDGWQFFFFMTLFCVLTECFFSTFEMASISINKVRLNYLFSKGNKRAHYITVLLSRPSYLFGTILVAGNAVMQLGSEYSRRFYESIGLSHNLAPITQILIVLIIGELAPAFAARKHAQQLGLLGVPIVYFCFKILMPIVWVIDKVSQWVNSFFGSKSESFLLLTKDEVERAFEEQEKGKDDTNLVVNRVFSLEEKKAQDLMLSLDRFNLIPYKGTVGDVKKAGGITFPFVYLFRNDIKKISGCIQLKDILNHSSDEKLANFSKPPWFILEITPVLQVLREFRSNRQKAAVVIDQSGDAMGILTLDQIIDALFGQQGTFQELPLARKQLVVDRTLSGEMTVEQFNLEFEVILPFEKRKTLEEIIIKKLGHLPSKGDSVTIDSFEFRVVEPTLLGIKSLSVRTL